jgi:hypothetical protein
VDVSFDESKGSQLTDTARKTDEFYFSIGGSDGRDPGRGR